MRLARPVFECFYCGARTRNGDFDNAERFCCNGCDRASQRTEKELVGEKKQPPLAQRVSTLFTLDK